MKRRRLWLWGGLAASLMLVLGMLVLVLMSQREPSLDGHPLSYHLFKLRDSHADVRNEALEYVREHKAVFAPYCLSLVSRKPTSLETFTDRLQSKTWARRLADRFGVPSPLVKAETRAMAALALSVTDLSNAEKIQALRIGMYDAHRTTRMESVKTLAAIGPEALPVFESTLTHASNDIRNAGLYGLYLLGADAKPAVRALKDLLINEDLHLDPLNYEVFWKIGGQSAEVLGEALDTTNTVAKVRLLKAMIPLRRHVYPFRDQFIAGLNHPEPQLRVASSRALFAAGRVDVPTIRMLYPLLKDAEPEVRLAALKLLHSKIAVLEPILPDLLVLLEDDSKEIRRYAGEMVERLPQQFEVTVPLLKQALKSENAYVREVAARALAKDP